MLARLSTIALLLIASTVIANETPAAADPKVYLQEFAKKAAVAWPKNRLLNVVCHGHSVPSGYFKTPEVRSLESYPHLLRVGMASRYPKAVINVIVTAIGGENSTAGAARFASDVLALKPSVITIDYALNDRRIGLETARMNWVSMIEAAQKQGVNVILLTPTPDQAADLQNPADPLVQHAEQIRGLAKQYGTGLCDSLAAFQKAVAAGKPLAELMSQGNHPNAAGHALVGAALLEWFPAP